MGTSITAAGQRESKSPKQTNKPSPPQDSQPESKSHDAGLKPDAPSNAEGAKPLAPPPRPAQQQSTNTPDYFTVQVGGSLSLEPNPFEQSFGGAPPETPGGTKLPPVATLTSPTSLLPGTGVTPFAWGGGSLRTGPLSPAMLSGPTADYFGDTHHIRGGFPTPNESSLRTGLTPGGSGSMFPAPSPSSQALFSQLTSSGATPGTLDFHRTALSAAAKREQTQALPPQQPVTSQPPPPLQEASNGNVPRKVEVKMQSGPFDPHDNDAANGLFMLAQGRNGTQSSIQQYTMAPQQQIHVSTAPAPPIKKSSVSPQMNGNVSMAGSSARGISEANSVGSDESEQPRPNTRGRGKRNSTATAATNGRRKADESLAKAPASKKAKTNGGAPSVNSMDMDMDNSDDEDKMRQDENGNRTKMTDEEKRKNFLERNRIAALKCRQRKKQWLANLQSKVELFTQENDSLTAQISQLREEVVNLKTLLLAHKDCPVTQQQGLHSAFMQQAIEPFNPQMNPYGMAGPIPSQPVMAGQGGNRRFS